MSDCDVTDLGVTLARIRAQAEADQIRITIHAQQEMVYEPKPPKWLTPTQRGRAS
jgi:hypothetical protein